MEVEQYLAELGITLPNVSKPVASYVPAVCGGKLLFVSGQLCTVSGELKYKGKVGRNVSLEDAYEAAKASTINSLAVIKKVLGSLDRVKRIVKVVGFVNSDPNFTEQHKVINGASDLLVKIFGDKGHHARSAVGVTALPFDASVEVELVVEIE
ncbi:endoribonuclease L-PSP [Thermacetogenium phaeum DSM 12270]|uniref:Endoribonuclease L-PSP n=1 Tax=Thermacetogenium phaeum (strain ATCC BAA-254 / DSM 26808 / PB) TaxID=1089553 RepID=K4LXD4_THEPS|nr:RidA family protein [Thermacetogenium phaeum]AFV12639.1 endoribonuclease L-PSP [Thermacetogenium phaeum DSM 12270]